MADALQQLKNRLVEVNNQLTSGLLIRNAVSENEAYILDLNTEEQLYEEGINRLGVKIADYEPYSEMTIQIKMEKGQPYDRVTLRDEGDFQDSFYMDVGNSSFEIKAGDVKTEQLIAKYGRQVLGLTNENLQKIITEYIYPDVLGVVKRILV